MNTGDEALEMFARDRQAWSTYHDAAVIASKRATEATYGAESNDKIIRIAMGGDFQIRALGIHPDVYDEIDEEQLSESIVGAYNKARMSVQYGLQQAVMNPYGNERQDPSK